MIADSRPRDHVPVTVWFEVLRLRHVPHQQHIAWDHERVEVALQQPCLWEECRSSTCDNAHGWRKFLDDIWNELVTLAAGGRGEVLGEGRPRASAAAFSYTRCELLSRLAELRDAARLSEVRLRGVRRELRRQGRREHRERVVDFEEQLP